MAQDKKSARKQRIVETRTEQPPRVVAGWTVARLEQAKRLADSGDLSLAADLCERIFGDERALGPLQAIAGISGVPLKFETAQPDTDSADDPLVAAIEQDWWKIYPEDVQGDILRWGSVLGVALIHTSAWDTDKESGRILPKLDVWHARALAFNTDTGKWKVRTKEDVSGIEIEPGDSEWQLFTPYGAKRPWAKAPWFGLGLLWFAATCAKLQWFNWNDSHSEPTRTVEHPDTVTKSDEASHELLDESAQSQLMSKVDSLVRGGSIFVPEGYKLGLLEATSKNWESFVKLCHEVWPMAVAIALTGNNLSTQIEGGSFAAAKEATGVTQDRKRTFARCLETTARSQCLTWWAEFNFASAAPPWPKYQVESPKDLTAAASRFAAAATGLSTLRNAGYEIEDGEEDRLEELLGVRVRKAAAMPPTNPGSPPAVAPKARAHAHERGTVARASAEADALEQGQDFVDALVEQGISAGAEALGPDLETLTRLITEATDLRSFREQLFTAYADMDPSAFLTILERAEVLAAMAGRWSAAADV